MVAPRLANPEGSLQRSIDIQHHSTKDPVNNTTTGHCLRMAPHGSDTSLSTATLTWPQSMRRPPASSTLCLSSLR
eukprot:53520-Alexandrium_andersonii.AAC.1